MINFAESDLFSFTTLTGSINLIEQKPYELGEWLPWEERGVNTLSVLVEEKEGKLAVIPTSERGTTGKGIQRSKRKVRSFVIPHYPHYDAILATAVQGVRQFGSEDTMETVNSKIAEKQAEGVANHEVTREFARACAVQGMLVDADGSLIYDFYDEFKVDPTEHQLDLSDANLDVRGELIKAKRKAEKHLGGVRVQGWKLPFTAAFFDDFVSHPSIKAAYDRWNDGAAMRDDMRKGFPIATDIDVVCYDNASVGDLDFMQSDIGLLCPNAPIYHTRYGPADTMEAANTIGLPLYMLSEPLPMNRGVETCIESNHISYVDRLQAICRITR